MLALFSIKMQTAFYAKRQLKIQPNYHKTVTLCTLVYDICKCMMLLTHVIIMIQYCLAVLGKNGPRSDPVLVYIVLVYITGAF